MSLLLVTEGAGTWMPWTADNTAFQGTEVKDACRNTCQSLLPLIYLHKFYGTIMTLDILLNNVKY
jgi:hypothetical protein